MRISDWSSDVCSSDLTGAAEAAVLAIAGDGRIVAKTPLVFEPGEQEARALLDLPTEMRNRIALLSIQGETTAGATVLLDERRSRRPVGLATAGTGQTTQPPLTEHYHHESELQPLHVE